MSLQALSGYRVLDLADESGVYGTKMMADMGADVIKIEPPGGDKTRHMPPFDGGKAGLENSLFFAYMNTNKKSVTLDLDAAGGNTLFCKAVEKADIVYETYPVGYLDARGIGYKQLSKLFPKLIWVTVTPFGQTGPRKEWKGSDLVGWATSGVQYLTGDIDRPPVIPGGETMLAYKHASANAAAGAMLALRARRRTGKGQMVDVSIQESATGVSIESGVAAFLDDLYPKERFGNRRQSTRPFGLYPCKDGYVAVIIVSPGHWNNLVAWFQEKIDVPEAVTMPEFKDTLYRGTVAEMVDSWTEALTLQYTKQEFFEEGQRRGISITPVNAMTDLPKDPHLIARNYWHEVDHPILGRMKMAGPPYRHSRTPWKAGRAPLLGEHNEEIYCRELGLGKADLVTLRDNGVL